MRMINKCEVLNRLKDCVEDINWDGEEWVIHLNWSKMVNRNITFCVSQGYNVKAEMKYVSDYFDNLDLEINNEK